ncbi:MAG: TonB-dependent receptor [Candidatus Marinimicrobia bacterium]|nr:TonB-dependent receptor [Candidatus Neomarinimicrobiota bacterium]
MKHLLTLIIVFVFAIQSLIASPGETVEGTIIDRDTQQPLPGANVILEGTSLGAATDAEGHFYIKNVPAGSYSVRVHMIGYKSQARANIHALLNRSTVVNIALEPTILAGTDVVVTAGYFERVKDAATSVRSVDFEEIRSDPVGAYDILSMMQALPSVVSGADQSNEIIVRGGSPGENLFVMDHLDIPYPVHYPQQGAGGGPVTMVNTDFIERIDFFAGSFPARYGDKLSSVMDVTVREGSRDSRETKVSFDMAGFGASFEGPLNPRSSYLFSIKRSFLDFVIQQSGLMAIPKYWTFQGKLAYDLSPNEKLYLNYLGGIDAIEIVGEDSPQQRNAENVGYQSQQHTLGLTYKNLFSTQGYVIASLAQNFIEMDIDAYRITEGGGHDSFYRGLSVEKELILKADFVYKFNRKIEFSTGFKGIRAPNDWDFAWHSDEINLYGYSHDTTLVPALPISEAVFYAEYFGDTNAVVLPIQVLDLVDSADSTITKTFQSGGIYAQFRLKPSYRTEITLGGRGEYNAYLKKANFSPRLNFSQQIYHNLKANLAIGRYFQAPFYALLMQEGDWGRKLDFYYADQIALGFEFLPREDLRFTLEIYNKEFNSMPRATVSPDTAGRDSSSHFANIGAGRSRGFEIFLQKKYSNNWYGSFSYSHSISEGIDPRQAETVYYPWDYDYRDVLSIVGGYKIKYMDYDWYQRYKKTTIAAVTSWLPLAPADEFEISIRFRYSGGKPYTPKIYDHNTRRWYVNSEAYNTKRHDEYVRFDIMLLQRFYFEKLNLVTFWDIMNVFNRDNPWEYVYNEDGTRDIALQFKTFPIGGITLEF